MSEYEYLTDEERAGIALHLPDIKNSHTRQIVRSLLSDLTALRAELRDCQIGIEQRNDMLKRMEAIIDLESRKVGYLNLELDAKETELDRMLTALEDAHKAIKQHCPNMALRTILRALNPQPAQPEKA